MSYVAYSNNKLSFYFQRRIADPKKCYPMETFFVNNWLFFKPYSFSQNKSPKTKVNYGGTQHILEKQKRVLNQVRGQVKHTDAIESQIYVVYRNPATILDVFALNGRCVASFDIKRLIFDKISADIELTQLDFVLIPVLKWSGRRNKILNSFGKTKNVFEAPKLVLVGQVLI